MAVNCNFGINGNCGVGFIVKMLMRFVNDVPSIRWLKPTAIIVGWVIYYRPTYGAA
jgi:hypothetical protein